MNDLEKLIADVEAGTWDGSWRTLLSSHAAIDPRQFSDAYHGSLNAAHTLHKALLPEWEWGRLISHGTMIVSTRSGNYKAFSAGNDNPARAWLLAVLMAYGRECAA